MSGSYAVLGGEGFLGHAMVEQLRQRYPECSITSLDVVQRHQPASWTFESTDLTDLDALTSALRRSGADTVFHTASPWTGAPAALAEKVNVEGTRTVIAACQALGIKKLVYTSSAGVVYNGADLINVDERLPFAKPFLDPYNDTKVRFL